LPVDTNPFRESTRDADTPLVLPLIVLAPAVIGMPIEAAKTIVAATDLLTAS
jgi:hypothetical protein